MMPFNPRLASSGPFLEDAPDPPMPARYVALAPQGLTVVGDLFTTLATLTFNVPPGALVWFGWSLQLQSVNGAPAGWTVRTTLDGIVTHTWPKSDWKGWKDGFNPLDAETVASGPVPLMGTIIPGGVLAPGEHTIHWRIRLGATTTDQLRVYSEGVIDIPGSGLGESSFLYVDVFPGAPAP